MPKAPINGIELYYESHGDDSAPAIVFAHGRGGNHLSWWQQVAAFSGEFRCITFDHRGWGASIAEHGTPLRENFIDDLTALLDYLEIDKTFLVAQSMGGFSCLGFALAHPERTLGLVLGDTTGGVATEGTLAALKNTNPAPEGQFHPGQPGPHLPLSTGPRAEPAPGRRRCHLGVPPRGRPPDRRFRGLADTDTVDCGQRGLDLPSGGYR